MVNYYVILSLLTALLLLFRQHRNQLVSSFVSLPEQVQAELANLHLGFSERPISVTQVRQIDDSTYLLDMYDEWGKRRLRAKDMLVLELANSVPRFSLRPATTTTSASATILNDVAGEAVLFDDAFHARYLVFSPTPAEVKTFLTPSRRAALLGEDDLVIEAGEQLLSLDMLSATTPALKRAAARRILKVLEPSTE